MNESLSLEKVIEYIATLSVEDEALLLQQLHSRRLEKQRQEKLQTGNAICDIRVATESEYWGDKGKATYHVLIKNEPDGNVSAQLLGWPDCQAIAATRQQAVLRLHELINALLSQAEIVPVEISSTQSDNPWVRLAGKYKDDPLFDEMLADIEAYRRELDAETEAYYRELDEKEAVK